MEIKVDKCVPVPAALSAKGKFPWLQMSVGDSFFAPNYVQAKHMRKNGEKTLTMAFPRTKVPGSKWVTRTVTENGIRGVRVWRVA